MFDTYSRSRWALLVSVLVILFGIWWGWISPGEWQRQDCARVQNAAWISVNWTSKPIDRAAVRDLAERAATHKLRYLYPFTSYLQSDGTFSSSYQHAGDFVLHFREHNEQTYLLAWVGIPVQNDRRVGIQGWVDLSDRDERRKIVDFAVQQVQEAGFDGVHLNVETVRDNDPNYLLLLQETKEALGPDPILSIASTYWLPRPVNGLPLVDGYRWSQRFYQAIADRVDQIATMTYDSLLPHPALYRLWMREQVRGISTALAGSNVELLIGISVSEETTISHKPFAENLPNGLAGFCAGLKSSAERHSVDGLAIYAAWEATTSDWQIWRQWLALPSSTTE